VEILILLIPLSVALVFAGAWAFHWCLEHDQFEDMERHGSSILDDDDTPPA